MTRRHLQIAIPAALAAVGLAGCGGGAATTLPVIQPAARYEVAQFRPAVAAVAGKPMTVSFIIRQPDGTPLTDFKQGPGPHTGVHVIIVRRDLAYMVHLHPPVKHLGPSGRIRLEVTLPAPGPYRTEIDVYPNTTGPQTNFQLTHPLRVAGAYTPQPLPPPAKTTVVDGYRFTIAKMVPPRLSALEAGFIDMTVTGPGGKPAVFTPWFGALAHAIFFRHGSLDYFHTHVCSPKLTGCTAVLGTTKVKGTSTTPGHLTVGVLVPAPGVWRLFLQCKADGHVLTAPFTLVVH